jgi:hypothetical protein
LTSHDGPAQGYHPLETGFFPRGFYVNRGKGIRPRTCFQASGQVISHIPLFPRSSRDPAFSVGSIIAEQAEKTPILSPDPDFKPTISRTRISTLIPWGFNGGQKWPDKPITRSFRRSKPGPKPRYKPSSEKIQADVTRAPVTQECPRGCRSMPRIPAKGIRAEYFAYLIMWTLNNPWNTRIK